MKTFGRADQSLQAKTQPLDDVIIMNIISIIDARACAQDLHAHAVKEPRDEKLHMQPGIFADRWVLAQMAVKGLARPRCKRPEYWL